MSAVELTEYSAVPTKPPPPYSAQFEPEPVSASRTNSPPAVRSNLRITLPESLRMGKVWLYVGAGVLAVIVLLLVILLPMSFNTLEFYEYGFKKRKTTGEVNRDEVFAMGRHAIGPDYEFKVFPASAHFESFSRVTVFAKDRLQVKISCDMQYFLRRDQLGLLHKAFDVNYNSVLKNNAMDALKGAATQYEIREYIRDREKVESGLFKAVRERLGGPCCQLDCDKYKTCAAGCKRYSTCSEDDFGLYTDVRYFQLQELEIPGQLAQKFLNQLVEEEKNAKEQYRQQSLVVRKGTEKDVALIRNNAREVEFNATSESNLLRARATAEANAIIETARSDGLKFLYGELNIDNQEQKAAFDYLRTLRGKESLHLTVDFNQAIVGPIEP